MSAQVNLLKNANMEEEGDWIVVHGNVSDLIDYEFGSTDNDVNGGEGGNLAIKHTATVADASNITFYQALDLVAEEEYLWSCAFRDLSPNLENCWWASYCWYELEPVDGEDGDEHEIVWMNEWQHKDVGEGFNGLLDTVPAMMQDTVETNVFIPVEDGVYYVGINVGTCITGGGSIIADIHFIYDEIALIDQDAIPSAVSPQVDTRGNSLSVYPNPAHTTIRFNYTISENSVAELSLINILGQEVAHVFKDSRSEGTYRESLDCSNLSDGMYYGVLKVNDSVIKKKILVIK
jgi:hypothetical protein